MQRRELADGYREQYGPTLSGCDLGQPESLKIRRGTVGGFIDYLSADDIDYCNEMLNAYKYFEILGNSLGNTCVLSQTEAGTRSSDIIGR
jgi:hypothetical protein